MDHGSQVLWILPSPPLLCLGLDPTMTGLNVPLYIHDIYQNDIAMPAIVFLSAALLYDHALTIGEEVRLVWLAPWSKPKALFLFIRYAILLGVIALCAFIALSSNVVEHVAHAIRIHLGILTLLVFFTLGCDMLFLLRVYAIWNQNSNVMYLFPIAVLAQAINVVIFSFGVSVPLWGVASTSQTEKTLTFIGWGTQVLFDTILFVLVLVKAAHHRMLDGGSSPLLLVYYRDGAGYYLLLLLVRVFLFIGCAVEEWGLYEIALHVYTVAAPVLATRMFLNLRGVRECESLAASSRY
ncbi:hypothetical protein BOTBODRAFT_30756 [Botryobasidium botryosum FD-172 SS1]|uniref:DUF6533 domain-containing protein n=1 Tax=Botryobasidium botryosum (strain FD-172 SS1) TaxID=930990 RepID=A0A067MM93_BOTB1|nr:hypothetical protein BOTBODRAFT_30756 [Botryobasidium botryosum FD-172 SS1]